MHIGFGQNTVSSLYLSLIHIQMCIRDSKKSIGKFEGPPCTTVKELIEEYVQIYGHDKWLSLIHIQMCIRDRDNWAANPKEKQGADGPFKGRIFCGHCGRRLGRSRSCLLYTSTQCWIFIKQYWIQIIEKVYGNDHEPSITGYKFWGNH